MQSRKHTAWKKNRRFGDVYGGRQRLKLTDNIFNRKHSLLPPAADEEVPILLSDSLSSDFYFPVSFEEIKQTLSKLPSDHTGHITHLWLRKVKKADYLRGDTIQGCFICGSGVNLIVLHAFPTDLKMRFGRKKPDAKTLNYYKEFGPVLHQDDNGWHLLWDKEEVKRYYLQSLLLHEVGHSLDSYSKQYWSAASDKRREDYADGYARFWANTLNASDAI